MKSRLKRELYEFLSQDDISIESNIVNELMYQMIGVKLDNEKEIHASGYGLKLGNDYWERDNNDERVKFNLPKLTMTQLHTYLDFFKISHDKYVTNSSLVLDDKFVSEELLPVFKMYYEVQKLSNPLAFAKYKIESKPILESSAITTLKEYTQKAINTILPDETLEASEDTRPIIDGVLLLESKVKRIAEKPFFYKDIINTRPQIEKFLNSAESDKNLILKKQLKLVSEGIDLFAKYHRCESVIASKNFMKDMENFLIEHQISYTACDVVEETVLRMAKAQLGDAKSCKFNIGSDASRLVFKFTDMNQENAERMVNYFRQLGDETANEGFGYRSHGSAIPESFKESAFRTLAQSSREYDYLPEKELESHSIEVDGKFFYKHIFPSLQQEICAMEINDRAILDEYRKASKDYLVSKSLIAKPDNLELTVTKNKSSLFQEPVVIQSSSNDIADDNTQSLTM